MDQPTLRQHIQSSELNTYTEELINVAAPAIQLTTDAVDADTPIGSTKLGGLPDLPPGVAWPVVDGILLEFVGQFRLEELAPYDSENRLPKTGLLYFFFDGMLTDYDKGQSPDRHAVLYYDGPVDVLTRREVPPHNHGYRFSLYNACPLNFETVWTLPPFEELLDDEAGCCPPVTPIFPTYSLWREYKAVRQPLRDFSHRFLGHPDEVQVGEMRLGVACANDTQGRFVSDGYGNYSNESDLIADMREWRLLAQIGSDPNTGMCWGDAGLIYFWIRSNDLAARRFDRVFGELECT